ncbi:MAG: acyclic terpene utilization AtuA family protein [Opitutaceae bacterium]|nr:acyclic terpene utilization AtuA family protein [Opitutaceae bacterium]
MPHPLTIANASAFWGDQPDAAARLVAAVPDLDYLTLDYLAELSLSIMAGMRAKDPAAGYARDFVDVVRSLVPFYRNGGKTKIVTNAGGLAPEACAAAVQAEMAAAGLSRLRIAIVKGDDVLPLLKASTGNFANLETDAALVTVADRLVTANAYLGAAPIADALRAGADIVITGRVADPSLTVGPCLAHYGWNANDYNRIAGATVAGHLIECGAQVCGGFSTEWLSLPHPENTPFPIAEVADDGSCVITKPPGSGGAVTLETVKEQLLYEVGDPGRYLSPDATVSFLSLAVESVGCNRVRVSGAAGAAPPATYKVSATYRDGYKAHGLLTIFGHDAVKKARHAGDAVLHRLRAAGCVYRESLVECLGTGASVRGIVSRMSDTHLVETVLRISVAADTKEPVERFTKEIAPLVTCGPQGVTGYATGRPKVLPILGYWPCTIPCDAVKPQMRLLPAVNH